MKKELKTILLNHSTTASKIVVGMVICLIISLQSGYAQEVDKDKSNKKKLRETRFKTRNKQGDRIHKGDITGRKKKLKKTKNKSKITNPSPSPYDKALYQNKDRRKEGKNVQRNSGYFNTPSRPTESHRKGDISGRKIRKSVTRTGEGKRVQPSANPYAGQKHRTESQKAKRSRAQGGGFQSITQGGEDKPRRRKKIQPRTASRAFITRKKVNVYAGRAKRGERAKTKDIAGRKIRSKNFKSRPQPIIRPSFDPYFAGKSKGDQAHPAIRGTGYVSISKKGERKYKGQAAGGYSTASKKGENAWKKDITGRNFKRPRDPGVVIGKKGQAYTGNQNRILSISGGLKNNERRSINSTGGGGTVSNRMRKGKGKVLPRRDLSTPQIGGFAGNIKGSRKSLKGGGSITNNIWKGKGKTMPRRDLSTPQTGGFAGNIKGSRKPLKGGGSITNNIWKGKGKMMPRRDLSTPQTGGFAGNIKGSRKPLKGGGSITNNIWKGKGKTMPRKDLEKPQISGFSGNIKGSRKPLKGGGSITNNIWKGKGKTMPRKDLEKPQISGFTGNIKGSRKPLKGGGSISRSGWNNDRTPLAKKPLPIQNLYASKFKGRFDRFEITPKFLAKDASKYRGTLKMKSKYKNKPHAVDEALKAKKPHKNMFQMSGYQGTMKDRRYFRKNPNVHNDALKGIAPRNSASKAMAFQSNFKSKKNYDRNMHPSSKYTTSLHSRNSLEEKGRIFKFNIWWTKLFKKNENQPTVVKEKTRNPRYDKREKDLWYD